MVAFLILKILEEKSFSIHVCYIKHDFRLKSLSYGELLKLASLLNVDVNVRRLN